MYEEKRVWLVLQTFWKREMEVSSFLNERGVNHFIPMAYKERYVKGQDRPKRILAPVVHNYIFFEKTMTDQELRTLMSDCTIPVHLLKHKGTNAPCTISNREMFEFRMLCDPNFNHKVVVQEGQEDAAIGKEVVVMHGQFAGVRGRLCRKQQKYWFIKTIAGISVMIRITRWFCKPVSE